MVDLGSLILLMSIFGWKVAVVYVIVGLVIAVVGGTLIEKLHLENQVEEFIRNGKSIDAPQNELTKRDRLKYSWEQVTETAKKVFPYVIVGDPQLDTRRMDNKGTWHGQSVRSYYSHYLRYPNVCGHIRLYPHSRGSACKGRKARSGTQFYDGSHHAFAAVDDHAEKSDQAKAVRHFHRYLYGWNYPCRIFLQYHSKLYHLGGNIMALFGKKKEETKAEKSCCCGGSQSASEVTSTCCGEKVNGICCIKVLGSGCKSCHQLYENTLKAVEGMGIEVEYITDLQKIMEYGAMSMPALVVNEKVVSVGRVLKPAEISEIVEKY